jgi:serine/threonine protein kinase
MWSAGVVLFAMLYGNVPFKGIDMKDLHRQILEGDY